MIANIQKHINPALHQPFETSQFHAKTQRSIYCFISSQVCLDDPVVLLHMETTCHCWSVVTPSDCSAIYSKVINGFLIMHTGLKREIKTTFDRKPAIPLEKICLVEPTNSQRYDVCYTNAEAKSILVSYDYRMQVSKIF